MKPRVAVALVVLLLPPYTWYFAVDPDGVAGALLELVPGVVGVGLLLAAGLRPSDCFLRLAPPSRKGLTVLAGVTVLLLPILSSGSWVGWSWAGVLIYAPLSGVAQELYFRSSLLPALLLVVDRAPLALVLHAVLFMLWHLRTMLEMPWALALVTAAVLLTAGLGWGWQTMHDRTVVWAMVQHTSFLMPMALLGLT
jgi:hypothetical protein